MDWDAQRYLAFGDERGRAFADLVARVRTGDAALVVDLGCGPGNLTAGLRQRWPHARIVGVDSSASMLAAGEAARAAGVELLEGDLVTWRAEGPVDVLLSNAALQWVPGHLELLPELVRRVASGGTFAFQVPGNFDSPSHVLMRELARSDRWRHRLGDLVWPDAHDATTYLAALAGPGREVDAWETTYLHVLPGDDAVLRWVSSTGLRPVLEALDAPEQEEFRATYGAALREAYPRRTHGTVLPFRRTFVVCRLG